VKRHSFALLSILLTTCVGLQSSAIAQQYYGFNFNNYRFLTPINAVCGTSNGTALQAAPTSGLCSIGSAMAVSGSGPWTWTCAGLNSGANANCATSVVVKPCVDANGALHANGVTYTQQVNTTGSTPVTASVCAYGGTQPTLTTVTQTFLCNNGTSVAQGSSTSVTENNGGLSCNAAIINGACGVSGGTVVATAPATNLCSAGHASAVTGTGPWSWSCLGSGGGTMASCSAARTQSAGLDMPPVVLQPQTTADIVGINIQNLGANDISGRYITFGQVFAADALAITDTLAAHATSGNTYQIQASPVALWPDGSVRLAAIIMPVGLQANGTQQVMISKTPLANQVSSEAIVNLRQATFDLAVQLNFASGAYKGTQTIDLASALRSSLASSPVYWYQGPLATQARVDVPLPGGPLHLTADVTVFKDGNVTADVQFNNDLTSLSTSQAAALPPLVYTATITSMGQTLSYPITQYQYQDWHAVLSSNDPPRVNVQHDVSYLEHVGAILPYDLTTGVSEATLVAYAKINAQSGFGLPLAVNGVTQAMGTTGNRPDIGYTTQYNTVWLLTGDARAATLALAQGDTAGAIPWNYKLANGHWMTPGDSLMVWIQPDSGHPTTTTQAETGSGSGTNWTLDVSHEPNLAYVPYIMTAQRWYLDRLNAEAAVSIIASWTAYRCPKPTSTCDIILNGRDQVRGQAWALREVQEAAFVGSPGSFEQRYFDQSVSDTYSFTNTYLEPALALGQGEMHGFMVDYNWKFDPSYGVILNSYGWGFGTDNSGDTNIKDWENDFLTGVVGLGALMGFDGARQYITWQHSFLTGRYIAPDANPRDGFVYQYVFPSPAQGLTWSALEANEIAKSLSNGTAGWNAINVGYYAALSRTSLSVALTLNPGDLDLTTALSVLNTEAGGQMFTTSGFQADPTFNVVPLR